MTAENINIGIAAIVETVEMTFVDLLAIKITSLTAVNCSASSLCCISELSATSLMLHHLSVRTDGGPFYMLSTSWKPSASSGTAPPICGSVCAGARRMFLLGVRLCLRACLESQELRYKGDCASHHRAKKGRSGRRRKRTALLCKLPWRRRSILEKNVNGWASAMITRMGSLTNRGRSGRRVKGWRTR